MSCRRADRSDRRAAAAGRSATEHAALKVAEFGDRTRVGDLALHQDDRIVGDGKRMVDVLLDVVDDVEANSAPE